MCDVVHLRHTIVTHGLHQDPRSCWAVSLAENPGIHLAKLDDAVQVSFLFCVGTSVSLHGGTVRFPREQLVRWGLHGVVSCLIVLGSR